jgi:hypothetical protein
MHGNHINIRLISLAALVAAIALPTPGNAASIFHTGKRLYSLCTAETLSEQAYCGGVITGTWDMYLAAFPDQRLVCLPGNVTVEELRDVVTHYLRDNPRERSQPASDLVGLALATNFPC